MEGEGNDGMTKGKGDETVVGGWGAVAAAAAAGVVGRAEVAVVAEGIVLVGG